MCRERPGTVAIFSGRNHGKAQRILSAVEAGMNVLADKPLIVDRQELPVLEAALTQPTTEDESFMTCRQAGDRRPSPV